MSEDHKKIYKNQGIDAEELHKRRIDRNVVLRKQKQEEQVMTKNRNEALFLELIDRFLAIKTTKFSQSRRT